MKIWVQEMLCLLIVGDKDNRVLIIIELDIKQRN